MAADVQSHYRGPLVYPHFSDYHRPPRYDSPIRSSLRSTPDPPTAKSPRPWSRQADRQGVSGKAFMSERQVERATSDNPTAAARATPYHQQPYHYPQHARSTQATTASVDAQSYGPSPVEPQPASTSPAVHGRSAGSVRALPPLPHALNASGASFSPASRSAGVLSILNPAEPDDGSQSRRRKASEICSPSSSVTILPPLAAGVGSHVQSNTTPITAGASLGASQGDRPHRKILTPRSPSLQRAASLSQLNPNSTTVGMQQTFHAASPRNRTYTIEPGTAGAPPLPMPPAVNWHGYSVPGSDVNFHEARRASTGAGRAMLPTSESSSPRSSYSPYSQSEQTSPAVQTLPGLYSSSSMPPMASKMQNPVTMERQRHIGVPISSAAGQNVYQMMTLETTSGTVQLPVDVQAASRVADDKRRRNAGASARFRQRRKEKEREASTTISRLEYQVRELTEDGDFYKRERDYLAGIVLQVPGGERHFPRPQSPRLRRSTGLSGHRRGAAGYTSTQEQSIQSPDVARSVRRRTSTLSLPAPQAQATLTGSAPVYHAAYAPSNYGQALAPHPPVAQSDSRSPLTRGTVMALAQASAPPQLMQAPPHTGPWNPYAERRAHGNPAQDRDGR